MLFGKLFIFQKAFSRKLSYFLVFDNNLGLFSGVWYTIFIVIYFLYNLNHMYYVNQLM